MFQPYDPSFGQRHSILFGRICKAIAGNNILISMTENGDPLENPIAERVNGIIKDEYLNRYRYRQ